MKTSRKFLFLILNLDGGGSEKIFTRIVSNLCQIHDIVVVTFYEEGIFLEEIKALPVRYYCISSDNNNTFRFARRLRRIIKLERPEQVISFLYYPNIIAFLALSGLKLKHIPSERSNHRMYLRHSIKHIIWKYLLRYAYQKSKRIVALTEGIKNFIIEDFRISDKKIIVIPNGLNFDVLSRLADEVITGTDFDPGKKNIVAVGRFTEAKNYPMLIEAFSMLHLKHPETRLHIIGSGELKEKISELVKLKNLEQAVSLPGFQKNPYSFIKKADCYVMSSKWEGFPNALAEAMFLNGHVVSTDCPTGPADIITHEHDGLLSPNDDAEKLSENLERILYDKDLRELLCHNSRISIRRFDEKKMVETYRKIIEED
jgi:glycosyltransferase involved in cell wall biosynthesis